MTRDHMIRDDITRVVRAIVVSVVCVVMVTSVTACGAPHALLGIHDAPKAKATSAPLTVDHAERILTRAFTAAYRGEATTGAAAVAAQKTAYTGQGLRAVRARVKLAGIRPAVAGSSLLAPERPQLLAVSRGFGFPRFIVAQTVASGGGLPILHLLISPDAATPYRISMSAEMVPLAKVKPFDPLSQGSPLVTGGTGLAVAPTALLNRYAAWMAFPAKSVNKLPFAADSFSGQVRGQAAGVAKDVAGQATFSQVHKVVTNSAYAVRQASGDALVFGVIEREDSFKVKSDQTVNTVANKAFVLLTGKKKVTRSASISTLEFVVFAVPRSKRKATLVAAREQVVAGSGS
ncbi:MAG: hypothetical protein IMZ75_04680 [Actinobacteria bacterium]|nr:hypothetical protein [Actinomycetota bacterium]